MKKYLIIVLIVVFILIMSSKNSEAQTNTVPLSSFKVAQDTVNKVNEYNAIISAASQAHNIPAARIKAHIVVESTSNPNADGLDGEVGLMQITQGALNEVNKRFLPNAPFKLNDLYTPSNAIFAGTAYLQILFERLGSLDKASEAYNIGAGNIGSPKGALYMSKIFIAEKLF
jgi:soluble lytic murein transglycosylase-like protein